MKKITRTICLSEEIDKDIDQNRLLGKSFSAWVEESYSSSFFSLKSKRERLSKLRAEEEKLTELIKLEEETINKERFFGFCQCCGEPMRSYISIGLCYVVCSLCGKTRLEEAVAIFKKLKEQLEKKQK